MAADKLSRLRSLMSSNSPPLAGYIIPTDDQHQSEYIAECDKRREYMTGFTGSAGTALVTIDKGLLWTDGRYYIQASEQLDSTQWTLMRSGTAGVPSLIDWIKKEMKSGVFIGYDPSLMSEDNHRRWTEHLQGSGIGLHPVVNNLVDKIWDSRPDPPSDPIFNQPIKYAGETWQAKVKRIRVKMKDEKCSALVTTALDSNAWLFNLRGSDIEYNPVFFSYSILTMDEARLYISGNRLTCEAKDDLLLGNEGGVIVCPYKDIADDITKLLSSTQGKIWIMPTSSQRLCSLIPKDRRISKSNPIPLMKAIKNKTEIEGMRQAHIKCAVALCEYYLWLENQMRDGKKVTEISASDQLEVYRKEQDLYMGPSFPTISASGPHAALCHYRPLPHTDRSLSTDEVYLCDTGCQFRDGTTDVTRTMHFGTPTDKQRECFTRVLKGNIALCTAIFPEKTQGNCLDALARLSLWKAGLNYRHGTGHGIGSFLNVHEGPQGIGPVQRAYSEPLYANMFVSDEPGFYEEGSFGVRIENIVITKSVNTTYQFGGCKYLTMESVTLVPIQLKMIMKELLTQEEMTWLNDYHQRCRDFVGPVLLEQGKKEAYQWLFNSTQPLT